MNQYIKKNANGFITNTELKSSEISGENDGWMTHLCIQKKGNHFFHQSFIVQQPHFSQNNDFTPFQPILDRDENFTTGHRQNFLKKKFRPI